MSKHHHEKECGCPQNNYGGFLGFGGNKNCCCNFPSLIILILIILQFTKRKRFRSSTEDGIDGDFQIIDNSILFIIALFYLSCCNTCK